MSRWCPVGALLLASVALAPAKAEVVTRADQGFSIRPPDGWTSNEQRVDGGLKLSFRPPDSLGDTIVSIESVPRGEIRTAEQMVDAARRYADGQSD